MFQEPVLYFSSENGATIPSIQIGNVLLSKDQSGLSRTLTEYLKDKKDLDSIVPKSIYKQ